MNIDMEKIRKIEVNKNKDFKSNFNEEDINFMRYVYNNMIESDSYESTNHYLAGIYELSVSDIKYLQKIYYYYFATDEERNLYINPNLQTSKSSGFVNMSIITSLMILIGSFGILMAFIIYNL